MAQPPGFALPGCKNHVCQLVKVLYELKQASRCWYKCICKTFTRFRYTQCTTKHCVFYKKLRGDIILVVVVVDDLSLTSSNRDLLLKSKAKLRSEFSITELGR